MSMVAAHDIGALAERQERAGTIPAFGFALVRQLQYKPLVTNERALLVANETTKRWHTGRTPGPLRAVCQISVHLTRLDETRRGIATR